MSRAHERANADAWALLVSAAGAVLLVVLPSLGMIAHDPAGSAALAVLALAFAMLVQSEIRCLLGASRPMARCGRHARPAGTDAAGTSH